MQLLSSKNSNFSDPVRHYALMYTHDVYAIVEKFKTSLEGCVELQLLQKRKKSILSTLSPLNQNYFTGIKLLQLLFITHKCANMYTEVTDLQTVNTVSDYQVLSVQLV